MQATDTTKTKRKREAKPETSQQLVKKMAESATELAQMAARAMEAQRMQSHRGEKRQERVMAILEQAVGIRGQLKRYWPLLSESDQEALRNFGFAEPRGKDKAS